MRESLSISSMTDPAVPVAAPLENVLEIDFSNRSGCVDANVNNKMKNVINNVITSLYVMNQAGISLSGSGNGFTRAMNLNRFVASRGFHVGIVAIAKMANPKIEW